MGSRLTNSSDETEIAGLFSRDLVFSIPYFQRAYKWSKVKVEQFEKDLLSLADLTDSNHFLGAIIVFGRRTNPSDPDHYEVIDGQQRLTTCYLALAAIAKVYKEHSSIEDAVALFQRYLVIQRKTHNITNAKLICCKEDRAGINHVFRDLNASNPLKTASADNSFYDYKQMPETGNSDGLIWKNYQMLYKFFEKQYQDAEKSQKGQGHEIINKLYTQLVNNMSVVQIVVKDPTDGPKIFDSLNSKQEPMTIGDLVRNEIFSRVSERDSIDIEALDQNEWHPFYEKFKQPNNNETLDKVFEQYFFPYVLILDPQVKKSEAFNFLRNKWDSDCYTPETIIADLRKYQDIYLDLCCGTQLTQHCPNGIKRFLNNYARMNAPSATYPFIMQLVSAVQMGNLDALIAEDIMCLVESFLVRRVVCGFEPTGLHAVFKSLWHDCKGEYSVEKVRSVIKSHSTVVWPNDQMFSENIKKRHLRKVKITPFLLEEWNHDLGGDIIRVSSQQIEHIYPEKPEHNSQWTLDWRNEDKDKKDCLANLLPISGSLNKSVKNKDYKIKRVRYCEDSALKACRDLAQKYEVWTPETFELRAEEMKNWALKRWKY